MNEQRLRALLRSGEDDTRPPATADLLEGVRLRLRRRTQRQAGVTVAATILLVSTLVVSQRLEPVGPRVVQTDRPAAVTMDGKELPDYAAEADLRAALVQRMIAGERAAARIRELEAELARPLPDLRVSTRTQVELAAATLFRAGERVRNELRTASAGCRQYQAVIEVYPETAWAQLARRRLADCPGS